MRYEDAEYLRQATTEEIEASRNAIQGVITVEIDGEDVSCYVELDEEDEGDE